ncbi:MAG TPA: 5,6-dimethylbenzimidazole synthase [Pyrinomonadaceae bacterium]|nr:5,6-dimethylbenzimidazole synthase [Pyrinomonadaceae bacterium]
MDADKEKVSQSFSESERRGLYRAIYERRDVRSEFTSEPVADEVLKKLLDAAHHAPSVGFMQPWSFIVVKNPETRRAVHEIFERAKTAAAEIYAGEKREIYDNLKLAGIVDAPVNVCVVCNTNATRGGGLGRQTMPETAVYSTVCAVQNLMLAARAENIGCGWVSIIDTDELRKILDIPAEFVIVAYLCLGYVSEFRAQPQLEERGWEKRLPLVEAVFFEQFGAKDESAAFFNSTENEEK